MTKKPKKLSVAYVEWIDSQTTYGWRRFDPHVDRDPAMIRSVGVVVDQCEKGISLSTSQSNLGNHVDFITIPRCAIKRIKKLRV